MENGKWKIENGKADFRLCRWQQLSIVAGEVSDGE